MESRVQTGEEIVAMGCKEAHDFGEDGVGPADDEGDEEEDGGEVFGVEGDDEEGDFLVAVVLGVGVG